MEPRANDLVRTLGRKLLTKPLWWWETRRPYPIREQVFAFPPLASAITAKVTLAVLTTARTANNAAWAIYSILSRLDAPPRVNLVVDGRLSPSREGQFLTLFPGIQLSTTAQHLAGIAQEAPALLQLARTHPMAGKMAAILNLQKQTDLLFSDDDVFAFRNLAEINRELAAGAEQALYLREQAQGFVQEEPSIKMGLQRLELDWIKDINVGLLLIRRGSLEVMLCQQILVASPEVTTWFPDTMLLAALLARVPSQVLSDCHVVSTQRQFYFEPDVDYESITLRHFVSPVRHLMYSRGMPCLSRQFGSSLQRML